MPSKLKQFAFGLLSILTVPSAKAQVIATFLPDRATAAKLKLKSVTITEKRQPTPEQTGYNGTIVTTLSFTKWGDRARGKKDKFTYNAKGQVLTYHGVGNHDVYTYLPDGSYIDTAYNDGQENGPDVNNFNSKDELQYSISQTPDLTYYTQYTRDDKGHITAIATANTPDGPFVTNYIQEWNDKGQLVMKSEVADSSGDKRYVTFKYDNKGKISHWESHTPTFFHSFDVTYDSRGLPLRAQSAYSNNKEALHKSLFTFSFK